MDISKALNNHFLPKKNARYERFIFKQTVQEKGESIDHTMTLDKILEQGRTMGQAESQVQKMATSDHSLKSTPVNSIQDRKPHYSVNQQNRSTHYNSKYHRKPENKSGIKSDGKHCYRCGGSFSHTGSCPAEGKTCNTCGERNHLSNVCMKKTKKGSRPPTRKKEN